jgi:hypothetical protein
MCSKHGYIKHGSIDIYKMAPGVVELITLAGYVVYEVYFYAEVCNPLLGSIIKATVSNINRFGILAEAGYYVGNEYQTVLEIIIAKNSVNIQSEIDLENVKIGDEVKVEVIGKKYELGEKKISAIGRIIMEVKATDKPKKQTLAEDLQENEEEDEEVYDDDTEEEEDQDETDEDNDEEEEDDEDETKNGGSDFFSEDDSFFSEEEDIEDDYDDGDEKESVTSEIEVE